MRDSSILDGNSFDISRSNDLDEFEKDLVSRRVVLGDSYRLFYRSPVHLVRGEGCYVYDRSGAEYLDAYNNVPGVGHANPRVVRAVAEQMSRLNVHTRYIDETILDYSERLLALMPGLDRVMYTNSGSESNDLAIRVARAFTGGSGVVVTAEAYHGTSALMASVSPAMGSDYPRGKHTWVIPSPDAGALATPHDVGQRLAASFQRAVADMAERGVRPAALLIDSIFSSDGVFPDPRGFLAPLRDAVSDAGAVLIADEVQPGFGRTGDAMWGYDRHGITPDIVTLGKAMGNGIPVSAMATRAAVLDPFASTTPYFNTFGGNRVSIAAATAVLDEIEQGDLVENTRSVGLMLRHGMHELARAHAAIVDVRGAGLYMGVEIQPEGTSLAAARELSSDIVNGLRDRHVLISSAGPANNVLKIRPPLVFGSAEATRLLEQLDDVLTSLEARSDTDRIR